MSPTGWSSYVYMDCSRRVVMGSAVWRSRMIQHATLVLQGWSAFRRHREARVIFWCLIGNETALVKQTAVGWEQSRWRRDMDDAIVVVCLTFLLGVGGNLGFCAGTGCGVSAKKIGDCTALVNGQASISTVITVCIITICTTSFPSSSTNDPTVNCPQVWPWIL